MGESAIVMQFKPSDGFLRRTKRKKDIKHGLVSGEAFLPRADEADLSFTFQDHGLQSVVGLKEFQVYNELKYGDLPGVCKLTFENLHANLLPPRRKEDPKDARYGKLHCITDLPSTELQREALAALASNNNEFGLPYALIEKAKRENLR